MIVYCVVDSLTVQKRFEEHNEVCPYDYNDAQKLLRKNIERYYKPEKVIEIDTGFLSIGRCVELIVEKLKEVQRSEL